MFGNGNVIDYFEKHSSGLASKLLACGFHILHKYGLFRKLINLNYIALTYLEFRWVRVRYFDIVAKEIKGFIIIIVTLTAALAKLHIHHLRLMNENSKNGMACIESVVDIRMEIKWHKSALTSSKELIRLDRSVELKLLSLDFYSACIMTLHKMIEMGETSQH